ncbi:hypothetical protein DH2020_032865 [Rehmannia glutinosa]|uniref:ABC1 atypical kinase-like domain-containing protein n=1 Tax=Rehmannia glutinosa TaxID=99300 RepID=A0ABR0VE63_REHGL
MLVGDAVRQLRTLFIGRLLTVGNIRRVSQSLWTKRISFCSEGSKYGAIVKAGLCSPQYRLFSQYFLPSNRHASNRMSEMGKGVYNSCIRIYSAIPASNTVAHHAQVAWKRLAQMSVHNGRARLPINRIAQAVSLGLSRSYIVVPGMFSLMCGTQVAYAYTVPEADTFQPRNNFYMHAEESHLFLTRLILSTFDCIFLLLRALYLAVLFTPSIAMAPFADSFGPEFRKLWLQVVHQTLERAGPAFIKWGQWAATRPDLFPRDLCTELSKLHTKAPEHSFAYEKTIEKAFGRKISEIFDDFEEEPVASGSIAQVHRASLRSRYRGRQIKPMLVAVKQFAVFMMSQVDLAREAAQLSRFIYNFRRWKDVSFPNPVYPLVHPAVLVETFEHGESVSHYVDELKGNDRINSALAHIGTHALLKMLLVDNFVHADMHPGNILVRVARSKPSRRKLFKTKPHVIFLDVGMTAELSKNDRVNLLEFFKAVARRDGRTAAECTLRLSKKQNCPKPEAFIQEVKESFDFWGTPEGDFVHPAECMQQLLEKVRRHRVNVDGNVCTVMVTVLVLEGWQRKLDPDYDVMHTLQTLLLKADWAESLSYTIERVMAP